MTRERLERIKDLLVCPTCRKTLVAADRAFSCPACGARFPVQGDVPILLPPEQRERFRSVLEGEGHGMAEEYRPSRWRRILSRLRPPSLLLPLEPALEGREMDHLFRDAQGPRVVLSVGGGPSRHRAEEINLNIAPFPNVDLVADGHRLPFGDGTVDTVICKAVLEHVEEPRAMVEEIARVLKPGGLVYLDIPFLFIDHAYPQDFTRFTRTGVLRLAREFEVLRMGPSVGPFSTILLLGNDFLIEALRLRGRRLSKAVSGLFRLLFFPWKYFDLLYRSTKPVLAFSGAYHFVGRKNVP